MVTRKIIGEGCRGLALVLLTKQAAWFQAFGEVALNWVDIPHFIGIFCTSSGRAIPTPDTEQYHVVILDAMGNSTGMSPQSNSTHVSVQPMTDLHPPMEFPDGPQVQTQWAKDEGGHTCVYASEWAADSASTEDDATLQQIITECPACRLSDEANGLSVSACCDVNEKRNATAEHKKDTPEHKSDGMGCSARNPQRPRRPRRSRRLQSAHTMQGGMHDHINEGHVEH